MIKKFIPVLLLAIAGISKAAQITEATALSVAQNFTSQTSGLSTLANNVNNNLTLVTKEFIPTSSKVAYYIFNVNQQGFVIVAGDDNVSPVLGYSDETSFDISDVNPSVQYLLDRYKKEIELIVNNNINDQSVTTAWNSLLNPSAYKNGNSVQSSVAPLTTTKWNQRVGGYNKFCPTGTPTGCVATAFAQVLKYHNFPENGFGYNSYQHANYGVQAANYAATKYNWTGMPNSLVALGTTQVQIDEVARLMYHVGVSINMDYGPSGSSAFSYKVADALKKNFGYDKNLKYINRNAYTLANWITTIKTELDASRIVFHTGFCPDPAAGHAFILDGYDPNDLFHINWGWGGNSDGYFNMANLNPGTKYTFNDNQSAIIGIKPGAPAKHKLRITGTLNTPLGVNIGSTVKVVASISNAGTLKAYGQLTLAMFDAKNTYVATLKTLTNITLNAGSVSTYTFSTTLGSYVPAKYKIGIYFTDNNTGFFQLVPRSTTTTSYPATFEVRATNTLRVASAMAINPAPVMHNDSCVVTVKVKNMSLATSFTGSLKASFYNLKGQFIKDIEVKNVSIAPNTITLYKFKSSNVTVSTGTYYVVISSKANNSNSFAFVSGSTLNKPSAFVNVVVPVPPPSPKVFYAEPSITTVSNLEFEVYPNPAITSTSVNIKNIENTSGDIYTEILNLNGEVVLMSTLSSTSNTIDLSTLSKGVYIIKTTHNNTAGAQKLVIAN